MNVTGRLKFTPPEGSSAISLRGLRATIAVFVESRCSRVEMGLDQIGVGMYRNAPLVFLSVCCALDLEDNLSKKLFSVRFEFGANTY